MWVSNPSKSCYESNYDTTLDLRRFEDHERIGPTICGSQLQIYEEITLVWQSRGVGLFMLQKL